MRWARQGAKRTIAFVEKRSLTGLRQTSKQRTDRTNLVSTSHHGIHQERYEEMRCGREAGLRDGINARWAGERAPATSNSGLDLAAKVNQ